MKVTLAIIPFVSRNSYFILVHGNFCYRGVVSIKLEFLFFFEQRQIVFHHQCSLFLIHMLLHALKKHFPSGIDACLAIFNAQKRCSVTQNCTQLRKLVSKSQMCLGNSENVSKSVQPQRLRRRQTTDCDVMTRTAFSQPTMQSASRASNCATVDSRNRSSQYAS